MDEILNATISEIINTDGITQKIELFKMNQNILKQVKFFFAVEKGFSTGFATYKNFSQGTAVRTLFGQKNLFILDEKTCLDMSRNNQADFEIDYSISLDTQIVSYLHPYSNNYTERLPRDIEEVFEFIAQDNVYVDSHPFLTENIFNGYYRKPKFFEQYKVYEILRTLDKQAFSKEKRITSKLKEQDLINITQKFISKTIYDYNPNDNYSKLDIYHVIYCYLLKMVCIQLNSKSSDLSEKMEILLRFIDNNLFRICFRELFIASKYFMLGQGYNFFSKIFKGNDLDKTITALKGMAWDLCHLRQMEMSISSDSISVAQYFFPAIMISDKRFIEVIDEFPLKAIVFKQDGTLLIPFYNKDITKELESIGISKDTINEYFSTLSKFYRNIKIQQMKSNDYLNLIQSLENELAVVIQK